MCLTCVPAVKESRPGPGGTRTASNFRKVRKALTITCFASVASVASVHQDRQRMEIQAGSGSSPGSAMVSPLLELCQEHPWHRTWMRQSP